MPDSELVWLMRLFGVKPLTRNGRMVKKRRISKDNVVKVTFALPADAAQESARVVGDFNGWAGTPMQQQRDGTWRATVTLQPARQYEFRYLLDGERWLTDDAADGLARNPFGQDNALILT
jgi:1,4-alpha-glucan branching enzyme